jgi:tetraacyldisaccharide 4'-kinase
MVSDGERVLASEREAGDEPRLLAERLRGVAAVISDANRFAAGQWAIKELGSEVFVLDDGFQHLNLQRDLNIVTIDATRPWGDRRLLPWGRLREPTRGLSRADCVVITRADQSDGVQALQEEIKALVPNGQVLTSQMSTSGFRQVGVSFSEDHGGLTGEIAQPVGAFCAVGNPAAFIQQLRDAGYDPVSRTVFPDHHRFSDYEITNIVKKAKAAGATSLITTAKDAVKLREFSFELPCYVLEIEVRIDDESRFLEMIRAKIAVR